MAGNGASGANLAATPLRHPPSFPACPACLRYSCVAATGIYGRGHGTAPNRRTGGTWAASSRPARIASPPSAERIDCVVRGSENQVWHVWSDNGQWREWKSFGGDI